MGRQCLLLATCAALALPCLGLAQSCDQAARQAQGTLSVALGVAPDQVLVERMPSPDSGRTTLEWHFRCTWATPGMYGAGQASLVVDAVTAQLTGAFFSWAKQGGPAAPAPEAARALGLVGALWAGASLTTATQSVVRDRQIAVYDWLGRDGDTYTGDRVMLLLDSSTGRPLGFRCCRAPAVPTPLVLTRDAAWERARASAQQAGLQEARLIEERVFRACPLLAGQEPAFWFRVELPAGATAASTWVVVNGVTGEVTSRRFGRAPAVTATRSGNATGDADEP